jgi:TRAP-type transport system periplasmic protein
MTSNKETTMTSVFRITAAALALAVAGMASAQEIKARLGTSLSDSHPQTIGARKFAELADKKSNGRIKITVYSGGQLGNDLQMQSALRGGTQELTAPSTATVTGIVKEFGVLSLPFSFATVEQADAVLDGPFGKSLLAKLPDKGLVGLAFWENGFRNLTNSKHAVNKVEDIAGLKIRVIQAPVYLDLFNGLGANAVPMAVTELFGALESKAVDGQENPFTVIHAQKFYDVQKYLSTTAHAYDVQVLLASKKFIDSLTPADQALLQQAAAESAVFQRQTSRDLNRSLRAELAKLGMQINDVSEAERARMRDKLQPVIAKHAAAAGEDVAKDFFAALAKAGAK